MGAGEINPTELAAALINQEENFTAGLKNVQNFIEGSCLILLLTENGIYAARDKLGRTPVVIGKKKGSIAVTLETCAFSILLKDIKISHHLVTATAAIYQTSESDFDF